MKLLITFHLGNEFKLNPQSTSLPYHITTSPFSKLFHSQLFINSNVTPLFIFYIFSQIKIKKISLKSDTRFYPFTLFFIQFYCLKILNYISIIITILTPLTDQSVKLPTDKLKSVRNGKIPTGKINKKIIIPRKISKDPLKLSRINLETFLLRRIYPSPAPIGSTAGLRIV